MAPEFAYRKLVVKWVVCESGDDLWVSALQTPGMAKKAKKPTNHLAAWRNFRGLTQEQLAEKANTTKSVISLLESGDRGLSDKWLKRLAPALRTRPGFLLDYAPEDLPTDILELWAEIPADTRPQVRAILETFRRKAG